MALPSWSGRALPPDPVYINNLMGSQITGGSTSVRDA
jgi:hypothetical protein